MHCSRLRKRAIQSCCRTPDSVEDFAASDLLERNLVEWSIGSTLQFPSPSCGLAAGSRWSVSPRLYCRWRSPSSRLSELLCPRSEVQSRSLVAKKSSRGSILRCFFAFSIVDPFAVSNSATLPINAPSSRNVLETLTSDDHTSEAYSRFVRSLKADISALGK